MNSVARTIVIALGTVLLASSMVPDARAIGGDQFLSLCSNSADQSDRDFCLGNLYAIAEALHGVPDRTTSIQDVSPEALLESAMSYIGALPEPRQQSSGELVVIALEASFPC